MYALYFNDADGGRAFITAVDDKHSALSMAKLLSRQDPREVVVIENRAIGDTVLTAAYRRGALQADDVAPPSLGRRPAPSSQADGDARSNALIR